MRCILHLKQALLFLVLPVSILSIRSVNAPLCFGLRLWERGPDLLTFLELPLCAVGEIPLVLIGLEDSLSV
jgi:hypothetical protein